MKNVKKVSKKTSVITNLVIDNNSVPSRVQNQIDKVQLFLTDDLLKSDWKKVRTDKTHFTKGFGYIVSEFLYHKLNRMGYKNLVPMVGKDDNGLTHWFLFHKPTSTIIDGTSKQHTKLVLKKIYKSSRGCGFLTKEPSKRTQVLTSRVK